MTIKKAVKMTAKLTETTDSGELSASREITVVKIENNWYILEKLSRNLISAKRAEGINNNMKRGY